MMSVNGGSVQIFRYNLYGITPHSFMSKEIFKQPDKIREENRMLEKYKLSFEPKDVKYIIVDKEDEILEMVNKIINIKQTKYTHADLQILTTRIISMEHIFEDFELTELLSRITMLEGIWID